MTLRGISRPAQYFKLFVIFLEQFLNSFCVMTARIFLLGAPMLSVSVSAVRGVLGLQECFGRWFVSSGILMKARVQGFPTEYCTLQDDHYPLKPSMVLIFSLIKVCNYATFFPLCVPCCTLFHMAFKLI